MVDLPYRSSAVRTPKLVASPLENSDGLPIFTPEQATSRGGISLVTSTDWHQSRELRLQGSTATVICLMIHLGLSAYDGSTNQTKRSTQIFKPVLSEQHVEHTRYTFDGCYRLPNWARHEREVHPLQADTDRGTWVARKQLMISNRL